MGTRYGTTRTLLWAAGIGALAVSCNSFADGWSAYGRDSGGTRYSPLNQITPENVGKLQMAWTFHTGDVSDGSKGVPGWYHMTSPPVVLDGVVVVGSSIDDNSRVDMPDGVVRGYDARSGKLLWKWEPLERPAGVTESAWKTGAGNAWSVIIADPKRHLVYVPTGSASPDYYGGLRPGDDRWANSVVALNSKTGKLVWGFQLVHHDLWDYDTAAPPLLTSLTLNGKRRQVLIAGNKTAMLYVLDPATGKPVLPIEERPVPQSTVPRGSDFTNAAIPSDTPRHCSSIASADGGMGADGS